MRYGLDFKMRVLECLKNLSEKEARAYTVSEILALYVELDALDPNLKYVKKTLRVRVWRCLAEWGEINYCNITHLKDGEKHIFVGHYKYKPLNDREQ